MFRSCKFSFMWEYSKNVFENCQEVISFLLCATSIWSKASADMLCFRMPTATPPVRQSPQACSCSEPKPTQNPRIYCIYSHPHMQVARLSHGSFEAPTWKERCALDEAQRALLREGPSRAAELRKSCAAQKKKIKKKTTWKRRGRGRKKRKK